MEENPSVIDYFFTASIKENVLEKLKRSESSFEKNLFGDVEVCMRYPLEDRPNSEFNPSVTQFCWPNGYSLSPSHIFPKSHPFVMTNLQGTKTFGSCFIFYEPVLIDPPRNSTVVDSESESEKVKLEKKVVYVPKCFGCISHWPYLKLMRDILCVIYQKVQERFKIESLVVNICREIPLPPPGQSEVSMDIFGTRLFFSRPPVNNYYPTIVNINMEYLFCQFSKEVVLRIFNLMICECRIVFFADNYTSLVAVTECLLLLFYPFYWEHVYIPLLPESMIDVLEAPVPFIVGIHRSLYENALDLAGLDDDIAYIDIDNGFILEKADSKIEMPEKVSRKILSKLNAAAYLDRGCSESYFGFTDETFKLHVKDVSKRKRLISDHHLHLQKVNLSPSKSVTLTDNDVDYSNGKDQRIVPRTTIAQRDELLNQEMYEILYDFTPSSSLSLTGRKVGIKGVVNNKFNHSQGERHSQASEKISHRIKAMDPPNHTTYVFTHSLEFKHIGRHKFEQYRHKTQDLCCVCFRKIRSINTSHRCQVCKRFYHNNCSSSSPICEPSFNLKFTREAFLGAYILLLENFKYANPEDEGECAELNYDKFADSVSKDLREYVLLISKSLAFSNFCHQRFDKKNANDFEVLFFEDYITRTRASVFSKSKGMAFLDDNSYAINEIYNAISPKPSLVDRNSNSYAVDIGSIMTTKGPNISSPATLTLESFPIRCDPGTVEVRAVKPLTNELETIALKARVQARTRNAELILSMQKNKKASKKSTTDQAREMKFTSIVVRIYEELMRMSFNPNQVKTFSQVELRVMLSTLHWQERQLMQATDLATTEEEEEEVHATLNLLINRITTYQERIAELVAIEGEKGVTAKRTLGPIAPDESLNKKAPVVEVNELNDLKDHQKNISSSSVNVDTLSNKSNNSNNSSNSNNNSNSNSNNNSINDLEHDHDHDSDFKISNNNIHHSGSKRKKRKSRVADIGGRGLLNLNTLRKSKTTSESMRRRESLVLEKSKSIDSASANHHHHHHHHHSKDEKRKNGSHGSKRDSLGTFYTDSTAPATLSDTNLPRKKSTACLPEPRVLSLDSNDVSIGSQSLSCLPMTPGMSGFSPKSSGFAPSPTFDKHFLSKKNENNNDNKAHDGNDDDDKLYQEVLLDNPIAEPDYEDCAADSDSEVNNSVSKSRSGKNIKDYIGKTFISDLPVSKNDDLNNSDHNMSKNISNSDNNSDHGNSNIANDNDNNDSDNDDNSNNNSDNALNTKMGNDYDNHIPGQTDVHDYDNDSVISHQPSHDYDNDLNYHDYENDHHQQETSDTVHDYDNDAKSTMFPNIISNNTNNKYYQEDAYGNIQSNKISVIGKRNSNVIDNNNNNNYNDSNNDVTNNNDISNIDSNERYNNPTICNSTGAAPNQELSSISQTSLKNNGNFNLISSGSTPSSSQSSISSFSYNNNINSNIHDHTPLGNSYSFNEEDYDYDDGGDDDDDDNDDDDNDDDDKNYKGKDALETEELYLNSPPPMTRKFDKNNNNNTNVNNVNVDNAYNSYNTDVDADAIDKDGKCKIGDSFETEAIYNNSPPPVKKKFSDNKGYNNDNSNDNDSNDDEAAEYRYVSSDSDFDVDDMFASALDIL